MDFKMWLESWWGEPPPEEGVAVFTVKELRSASLAGQARASIGADYTYTQMSCQHEMRHESLTTFVGIRCWKCGKIQSQWINTYYDGHRHKYSRVFFTAGGEREQCSLCGWIIPHAEIELEEMRDDT